MNNKIDYKCKNCDIFFDIPRSALQVINPICPECDKCNSIRIWTGSKPQMNGHGYLNNFGGKE